MQLFVIWFTVTERLKEIERLINNYLKEKEPTARRKCLIQIQRRLVKSQEYGDEKLQLVGNMMDLVSIHWLQRVVFTAPFNNMRTLKFKAQPTNAFFATVNQMLTVFSQLSTAAKGVVIKSLCTVAVHNKQSSAEVVSWEDLPNTWLTAAKNAFAGWGFNFRVRVLLKSAVNHPKSPLASQM